MNDNSLIFGQNGIMSDFVKTDNILSDMRGIIDSAQRVAYRAVNAALVQRNWLIGHRIAEEELNGERRAEYGAELIKKLSKELTAEYGKGFTKTNLYSFYLFTRYTRIFSTQRVENMFRCSRGRIIEYFCRWKTIRRGSGMKKRRQSRRGVCGRCRGT